MNDLLYALRSWTRSPGLVATAVLTLGLGIGANTVIYSFTDHLVVRPLDLPQVDRLVALIPTDRRAPRARPTTPQPVDPATFREWRAEVRQLEGLAATRSDTVLGSPGVDTQPLRRTRTTASLFGLLRRSPASGRVFTAEAEIPGNDRVAVVSAAFWDRQFPGQSFGPGRTLRLGGVVHEVIGVMPRGFDYPHGTELWTPLALSVEEWNSRVAPRLEVIGRLARGVSQAGAQAELDALAARQASVQSAQDPPRGIAVVPLGATNGGGSGSVYPMALAGGASLAVLLLACANVANLQLARALQRRRELTIRAALGASRARIVRQVVTESVLLAVAGGGLGLGLAYVSVEGLRSQLPTDFAQHIAGWNHVRVEVRALVFSLALGVASGVLAGWLPGIAAARFDLNEALKEGSLAATPDPRRQRLRGILVAAQLALTLVLLGTAGILSRTFVRWEHFDTGMELDRVLSWQMEPTTPAAEGEGEAEEPGMRAARDQALLESLAGLPGFEAVALASTSPLNPAPAPYEVEGQPATPGARPPLLLQSAVTPDYRRVLGLHLKEGRWLEPGDTAAAARVAVVTESFAQRHFPPGAALGARFRLITSEGPAAWRTIVGVVATVRPEADVISEAIGWVPWAPSEAGSRTFLARVNGDLGAAKAAVQVTVAAVAPGLNANRLMSLRELQRWQGSGLRFIASLLSGLSVIALALALVGLGGVVSQMVVQRTPEVGIRMALGADRGRILRLMLGQGLRWAVLGVGVGLPMAIALHMVLAASMAEIVFEPWLLTGTVLTLTAAALMACWLPARRATRVDPMVALRSH